MHIGRIAGSTRNLGAPPNWDPDRDGPCQSLPVRDELVGGKLSAMTSAWFPTPEELLRLVAGAPIYLKVLASAHPPVMLSVGETPDATRT
ncbi:MAG: hypothetical protein P4L73_20715 [Caulobacteraceae bacterium]|nr:hypothetical protein [Caulobacteraceae bacterium]